jgi:hypothetical protein
MSLENCLNNLEEIFIQDSMGIELLDNCFIEMDDHDILGMVLLVLQNTKIAVTNEDLKSLKSEIINELFEF